MTWIVTPSMLREFPIRCYPRWRTSDSGSWSPGSAGCGQTSRRRVTQSSSPRTTGEQSMSSWDSLEDDCCYHYRKAKKLFLEFLDSSHNRDILYVTRYSHMEERQVCIYIVYMIKSIFLYLFLVWRWKLRRRMKWMMRLTLPDPSEWRWLRWSSWRWVLICQRVSCLCFFLMPLWTLSY